MKKYLEWAGTISSIMGAWLLPLGYIQLAYIAFSIGSGVWLGGGFVNRNKPLIVLNLAFFGANCFGLYKVFL